MTGHSDNSAIEQELRRGLALAYKKMADMTGVTFEPDKFLTTRFINAADGKSLEYAFDISAVNNAQAGMKQLGGEYRLAAEGFKEAVTEMQIALVRQMNAYLGDVKQGTFRHEGTDECPLDEMDKMDKMGANVIEAKTLDDLFNGINSVLSRLGVPENEYVKVPQRGRA